MCSICEQTPCFFKLLNKRCDQCGCKMEDEENTYPVLVDEGIKEICKKCFDGDENEEIDLTDR